MHLIGRSLFHFTIIGRIGPPPCESREHPFRGGVRRVAPYRRPPMLNRIGFFRRISISRVVFRRSGEWRHRCPASCFVPAFHADHVRPPREPVNLRLDRCPQWAKRSGASGSGYGTRFQPGCPPFWGIAPIKMLCRGQRSNNCGVASISVGGKGRFYCPTRVSINRLPKAGGRHLINIAAL